MVAHEQHITVTETGRVTVSGLLVQPRQRVRVTVAVEEENRERLAGRFRGLFEKVQALPHIERLTDDEIASEIALHRRSLGAGDAPNAPAPGFA